MGNVVDKSSYFREKQQKVQDQRFVTNTLSELKEIMPEDICALAQEAMALYAAADGIMTYFGIIAVNSEDGKQHALCFRYGESKETIVALKFDAMTDEMRQDRDHLKETAEPATMANQFNQFIILAKREEKIVHDKIKYIVTGVAEPVALMRSFIQAMFNGGYVLADKKLKRHSTVNEPFFAGIERKFLTTSFNVVGYWREHRVEIEIDMAAIRKRYADCVQTHKKKYGESNDQNKE